MTWYDMHVCVYDYIRANEQGHPESFDASGYDLTAAERAAFDDRDVAAFYQLGLHGVLLNRYCRQIGYTLDGYREVLQPFAQEEERRGRWQTSS
jgi:hypothetical protein